MPDDLWQHFVDVHVIMPEILAVHIDFDGLPLQQRSGIKVQVPAFKHMDGSLHILVTADNDIGMSPVYADAVIQTDFRNFCRNIISVMQQPVAAPLFLDFKNQENDSEDKEDHPQSAEYRTENPGIPVRQEEIERSSYRQVNDADKSENNSYNKACAEAGFGFPFHGVFLISVIFAAKYGFFNPKRDAA